MKNIFSLKRKRVTAFAVYIAFFLFNISPADAQSTLRGKVTDENGKALPAVSIYIPELEKGAFTDLHGEFHINTVGKKTLRLECSLAGYLTVVQSVDMSRQNDELQIRLQPTGTSMEEVVVTSNQTQLARNIPYLVNSLSAINIKRSGQTGILETLAYQPGIDIISGGSGIGKPVIRGSSFNRIVLYSMGTKIENQQWDDDHDAGIGEAGVEKVEIVYGPSALIYGADALGGAIIFSDGKPAPAGKTSGNIDLNLYSNTKGINGGASLKSTSASGFFYLAQVNAKSHADYIQGGDHKNKTPIRYATNSRFNNLSTKLKIGLSRKWGVSALSYSYLHSLNGLIVDKEEDSTAAANGEPYNKRSKKLQSPYQDMVVHIISFENTVFSGRSKWNINAAWQINNRKEFEEGDPGTKPNIAMGLLLHTFTFDTKWSSPGKDKGFGVTVGTQGMLQTNRNFGSNIAVPDADVNDFAGYGLVHYNPNSLHWNFLGGLRFDLRSVNIKRTIGVHEGETELDSLQQAALSVSTINRPLPEFKKYYYPFSFSLGTVYHASKKVSVKANLATGFSAPNYAELSTLGRHAGTFRFEVGNSGLEAEQNIEGDINAVWASENISFTASAFYNSIKNYIYLSPTGDSIHDLEVVAYQQNTAAIYGGEFGVSIYPARAKWLRFNSTFSAGVGKLAVGYLPYFPSNKIQSEFRMEKDSIGKFSHPWFSVMMANHFAQNHPAAYEEPTPGYTIFDVNFGIDFKIGRQRVRTGLFCTNILNTAYYNHLSIVKDIGVYERGRNTGLRVSLPFGD